MKPHLSKRILVTGGAGFLGGCPRIGILVKIEAFLKNKHSHMFDIASIVFQK